MFLAGPALGALGLGGTAAAGAGAAAGAAAGGISLGTVGTIASVAASLVGAFSSSAPDYSGVYEYNAQVQEQNARDARVQGSLDAARERAATRRRAATATAAAAEGGSLSGTGFGVINQIEEFGEMDAQTLEYNGELRALQYETGADLTRLEGAQRQKASRDTAFGTRLSAVGGAVGQIGRLSFSNPLVMS